MFFLNEFPDRAIRWWSPEWYARRSLARAKQEYRELKQGGDVPSADYENLKTRLAGEIRELHDWISEIESGKLLHRADEMDLDLDDIQLPENEKSHLEVGMWGNEYLNPASRKGLKRAMRERALSYRKERREVWDLRLKIFTGVVSALTGLVGAAIGLIALLKK